MNKTFIIELDTDKNNIDEALAEQYLNDYLRYYKKRYFEEYHKEIVLDFTISTIREFINKYGKEK